VALAAGGPSGSGGQSPCWAAACVHREDAASWHHLPARDWKAASDLSFVALTSRILVRCSDLFGLTIWYMCTVVPARHALCAQFETIAHTQQLFAANQHTDMLYYHRPWM